MFVVGPVFVKFCGLHCFGQCFVVCVVMFDFCDLRDYFISYQRPEVDSGERYRAMFALLLNDGTVLTEIVKIVGVHKNAL